MSAPSSNRPTHRRPLLLALAGGAAAVTGVGAAARSGLLSDHEAAGKADGLLSLTGGDMGVRTLELPLTDDVLARTAPGRWGSATLVTSTHSMVGFTWRAGAAEPEIEISSRVAGSWGSWQRVPHAHHSADAGSGDDTVVVGTDVAWTGRATGLRVRVRGVRPTDLTLVLIHPTPLPSDRASASQPTVSPVAARAGSPRIEPGSVPRPPHLRTRKDWGANESFRDGKPAYNKTLKQMHVHHTVNSNDYSKADVPALIRGMYAYHTQSLGWSDLGYNFLVDRFGRIWVGRAGGPGKNVRGAHTLGFNQASVGVGVIGNYENTTPPPAVIGSLARVAAWKLSKYDRDPLATIRVRSQGSDNHPEGERVRLPVIDGHRDTNQTACPGQELYDALPKVRRRTRKKIERLATKE